MAFVFTILASVFLITSSGFVCVIQAQGVSLLVSPPLFRIASEIINKRRSRLLPSNAEMLLFVHENIVNVNYQW